MPRHIFLIRAVNVGGAKLPMDELREMATALGAEQVSTYIASGNLLGVPPGAADAFGRALEAAISERYGYFREVIARSVPNLRAALAAYPFEIVDDRFAHLYFLTATPTVEKATAFADRDFGADEVAVIGADLHIRYANGAGQSTLTAPMIARGLGVPGTGRNLRTVRKLIDLAA
ncbi:MAG: DUF1697 domain-containing protein [Gordonia sp. (in: high G+C Gram-positive bacteria)]